MNPSQNYHREAMKKAEEANVARRADDRSRALQLFSTAYFLERLAADAYQDRRDLEPTRSVYYRSAAALALQAHRFDDAEEAIELGLNGSPPDQIESELLELRETVAARSANWKGAIRDFKSLLFSRARKLRRGNVLAIELSRVALGYGQKALEAYSPSEFLAVLLRVEGETMRSMLTPDEWHRQIIEASGGTQSHESGHLLEAPDTVQRANDVFGLNIPVDGSLAAAALADGKPRALSDANASDAAKYFEVKFLLGTFRTFLAVPVRVSIDKSRDVVAVLLVLGKRPTPIDEGTVVRRIVDDFVALLEFALTMGARTREEGTSRRRSPKKKNRKSH
jgi:hypothetical protein